MTAGRTDHTQFAAPAWVRQPAITGSMKCCLNCGMTASLFAPDARIAVGFGMAALTCDGRPVWDERGDAWEDCLTGAQAEELALSDPDHDWRIEIVGPLSERAYQRHGPGLWALISQGPGFA